MKQYSSLSFFEKNKMEIDERVLNEFFVYLCSDNPDILHKLFSSFQSVHFVDLLCGKEERQKMKILMLFG